MHKAKLKKYLYFFEPKRKHWYRLFSNILDHPDDKPVKHLNKRDDTERKAQAKQATLDMKSVSVILRVFSYSENTIYSVALDVCNIF